MPTKTSKEAAPDVDDLLKPESPDPVSEVKESPAPEPILSGDAAENTARKIQKARMSLRDPNRKIMKPTNANGILLRSSQVTDRIWRTVPAGTHPHDLLNPAYWANIADSIPNLRRGDTLDAMCVDGSWQAHYQVVDYGPHHIKMRIKKPGSDGIDWIDETSPVEWGEKLDVDFTEGRGWFVRRRSDNQPLIEGLADRAAAEKWKADNYRNMAA